MKKLTAIITATMIGLGGLTACSNQQDAISAAKRAGWTNVKVDHSSYFLNFSCGQGEMAYFIEGNNPKGEKTQAAMCCGYTSFKDCTIRY